MLVLEVIEHKVGIEVLGQLKISLLHPYNRHKYSICNMHICEFLKWIFPRNVDSDSSDSTLSPDREQEL